MVYNIALVEAHVTFVVSTDFVAPAEFVSAPEFVVAAVFVPAAEFVGATQFVSVSSGSVTAIESVLVTNEVGPTGVVELASNCAYT
jgi:hypothetical protein